MTDLTNNSHDGRLAGYLRLGKQPSWRPWFMSDSEPGNLDAARDEIRAAVPEARVTNQHRPLSPSVCWLVVCPT
jgi:hypothetical protein